MTGASSVECDMHDGEAHAAKAVFTRYRKDDAASGAGAFTAPFDSSYGWCRRSDGTRPVTVTAAESGFYRKLCRP